MVPKPDSEMVQKEDIYQKYCSGNKGVIYFRRKCLSKTKQKNLRTSIQNFSYFQNKRDEIDLKIINLKVRSYLGSIFEMIFLTITIRDFNLKHQSK